MTNNQLHMLLPIPYWREDVRDKSEEKHEEKEDHIIIIDLYEEEEDE